jgi:20S proteasome alpha/beta subunit
LEHDNKEETERMIRLIFLCSVNLALAINAGGTSIVAIRTPDKIIIVADSKRIFRSGMPSQQVCKIRKVGGVYFSIGRDRNSRYG